MIDKELIFREICNIIKPLNCNFDYHQLHDFVVNINGSREFRLCGKFGFGFKIYYGNEYNKGEYFTFSQYPEQKTIESEEWIKEHNDYLYRLCQDN